MNREELRKKALSKDFQDRCWNVLVEILEEKYNQKIKIVGIKNELASTSSSK